MADTLDPAVNIHEGFWTDWSKGGTWGLTWTLCPTQATILTNSLTLFVAISGIQLWTIVRYILHQQGAPALPELATPHLQKQQRILRNASSDLATARLMLNLAWSTRRSTGKRSLRSFVIGIFAALYAVLFMSAGIFSNKAISAGTTDGASTVVSRTKGCGVWNQTYFDTVNGGSFSNEDELQMLVQYYASLAHTVQLSLEYAQRCYLSTLSSNDMSSTCNTLKAPRLNWDTRNETRDGACPFQLQMCHNKSDIYTLDTGEIDSHKHLGINADPKDRLTYQRITTCAVLNDTGYVQGWDGTVMNTTSPKPDPDNARAYYGPSTYKNTNYTYSYSNFASFYDSFTSQVTTPYQLDVELAYGITDPQYSIGDFEPTVELVQPKADTTLMFLSFTGKYLGQIDDPWFSAHKQQQLESKLEFLTNRYGRDAAISTLGCTERHKFCTSQGICTDLLGFDQVQNVNNFNTALTPHQNATFDRMLRAVGFSTIKHVVEYLALTTNPLLASNITLSGGTGAVISPPLPEDQWKHELNYWHSISMAQLQRTLLQWGTGQVAPEPQYVQYILPPTEEQDIWFCKNMIVPSMVYESFSVVAIILIVISGTLVIVTSLTIEHLASLIRRCFKRADPKLRWDDDDMLELRQPINEEPRSIPPQPLPKDEGYRPTSRRAPANQGLGLSTDAERKASVLGDRRVSSQALPPQDPAFSFVSDWIDSLSITESLRSERRPRSRRESWRTISLNSLPLETPEISSRTQRRSPKPTHVPPPPPPLIFPNPKGLRVHNSPWAQGPAWV